MNEKFPKIAGLELVELIGKGTQSTVFKVARGKEFFALKLAKGQSALSPDEVWEQLLKEAQTLSRINHPGLLQIFDIGRVDGTSYIVTEFIEGESLASYLKKQKMSEQNARRVCKVIAAALGEVHKFRIVHRDIKPSNILLGKNGEIKLIDLGLANRLQDSKTREAVGTWLYSAPEQIGLLKCPVDERSDLYSLGVTLFECLTGKLPFSSDAISDVTTLQKRVTVEELKLNSVNVSDEFASLVVRLMAKDPDDRIQSTDELLKRLGADGLENEKRQTPVPFVGREAQLSHLKEGIRSLNDREGGAFLISGQAGFGKSHLVKEALREVPFKKHLQLTGKCLDADPRPFRLMQDLLNNLKYFSIELEGRKKIIAASTGFEFILTYFSPNLAQDLRIEAGRSGHLGQDQLVGVFAEFFGRLSEEFGALILFIDDAQWLDDASSQVLRHLSHKLKKLPLLMIVTIRSGHEYETHQERITSILKPSLKEVLELPPLDLHQMARLALLSLGNMQPPQEFCRWLFEISRGSPFAALAYMQSVLEQGILLPHWGQWIFNQSEATEQNLPTDILKLVLKNIDRVSSETVRFLKIASLIEGHLNFQVLPLLCGVSESQAQINIGEALQNQILEFTSLKDYRFSHDKIREALVSLMDPHELRDSHRLLAERLEGLKKNENADFIYALARHYALGEAPHHAVRIYETNLAAGQLSVESFAYEEAFVFLEQAHKTSLANGIPPALELFECLGEVMLRRSQLLEAEEYLRQALLRASDPWKRAKLRAKISEVMIVFGYPHTGLAWKEILGGLKDIGFEYPKSPLIQILATVWHLGWILLQELILSPLGFLKNADNQRNRLLANLYNHASRAAYSDGLPVIMPQTMIRALSFAVGGGYSRDLVEAYTNLAIFVSIGFQSKIICTYLLERARLVANHIGDPTLHARIDLYEGFTTHYRGDASQGQRIVKKTLKETGHWLDTWDYSSGCLDLGYNLLMRGYAQEAVDVDSLMLTRLDSKKDVNCFSSAKALGLSVLGDGAGSLEILNQQKQEVDLSKNTSRTAMYSGNWLLFLIEQNDWAPCEPIIDKFKALKLFPALVPYHWYHFYLAQGYMRLRKLDKAEGAGKSHAQKKLAAALFEFGMIAKAPIFKCHFLVLKAGLVRHQQKFKKAKSYLHKAYDEAVKADSPWGLYEVALESARLRRDCGAEEAEKIEAGNALQTALTHGWYSRVQKLVELYGLTIPQWQGQAKSNPQIRSGKTDMGYSNRKFQRYHDALLQLSATGIKSINPQAYARFALEEMLKIFGAERAFLLLPDDKALGLRLVNGIEIKDGQLHEMKNLEGYSRSLVEQVRISKSGVVVSGTENGEIKPTESMIAHNLRSIMVAPLLIQDRLLGVVYLDNRVAKGLFVPDDLEILQSLGNQVAMSLETARAAQIETEKIALEKDLAVTAAVQSIILPKVDLFTSGVFQGAAFYQPATVCGGDWWWQETGRDGVLRLVVGDVTGHGPGPAMVTAILASNYQLLQNLQMWGMEDIIKKLNSNLWDLCRGSYVVSMSALEIDPKTNRLTLWCAGGLPLLYAKDGLNYEALVSPGTPLGSEELICEKITRTIEPGSRIFMHTDGVSELRLQDGEVWGLRRMKNALSLIHDKSVIEARDILASRLKSISEKEVPEDDTTFIIVDYRVEDRMVKAS